MTPEYSEDILVVRRGDQDLYKHLWTCLRIPNKYLSPTCQKALTGRGWVNGNSSLPISWKVERTPLSVFLHTPDDEQSLGPTRETITISTLDYEPQLPFYISASCENSVHSSNIVIAICKNYQFALSRHNSHIWWGGIGQEFFDGILSIDNTSIAKSKSRKISTGDWVTISIGDSTLATGAILVTNLRPDIIEAKLYSTTDVINTLVDQSIFAMETASVCEMASAVFFSRIGRVVEIDS